MPGTEGNACGRAGRQKRRPCLSARRIASTPAYPRHAAAARLPLPSVPNPCAAASCAGPALLVGPRPTDAGCFLLVFYLLVLFYLQGGGNTEIQQYKYYIRRHTYL